MSLGDDVPVKVSCDTNPQILVSSTFSSVVPQSCDWLPLIFQSVPRSRVLSENPVSILVTIMFTVLIHLMGHLVFLNSVGIKIYSYLFISCPFYWLNCQQTIQRSTKACQLKSVQLINSDCNMTKVVWFGGLLFCFLNCTCNNSRCFQVKRSKKPSSNVPLVVPRIWFIYKITNSSQLF